MTRSAGQTTAADDGPASRPADHRLSSTLLPVLAASYYIATSVVLTLLNKTLFSHYTHVHAPFLLFSQSVTSVAVLLALALFGKFSVPPVWKWPASSWTTYAPLYVSNILMLLTATLALKLTSLLMYNTLRRASMVFVVTIHCLLNRTRPRHYTVAATTLVTGGAFVAGKTDLAFDALGYSLAFVANLCGATYLVLVTRVRDALHISNIQLVFVNALTNVPLLGLITRLWPPQAAMLAQFSQPRFCLVFFGSCLLSMIINHATFVNTTTNDAIAQSVAAQLKDVVLLVLSVAFIDDASSRAKGNIYGVLIGFLGSLLYGLGKLRDRQAASAQSKHQETHAGSRDSKNEDDEDLDASDSTLEERPLSDAFATDDQKRQSS